MGVTKKLAHQLQVGVADTIKSFHNSVCEGLGVISSLYNHDVM